jgi:DNA ligase (NAD+)
VEIYVEQRRVNEVINGKTFVLTGSLTTMTRDEAKELLRSAGGKIASSVSAATDYVVAGEKAGSKLVKARQLSVPIISESDLRNMVQ